MEKFLDDELELDEKELSSSVPIEDESLAGEKYNENIKEINNMIDTINRRNANSYKKSSFCSIG